MKIIVHFGMPKTGSSSIQASLFRNMPDRRFHYVNLGQANHNELVNTLFMNKPQKGHMHRKKGNSLAEVARLRDEFTVRLDNELKAADGKTIILSAEVLSNFLKSELQSLYEYLRRYSSDIVAVAYIRPPKGLMESGFQQRLKADWQKLDFTDLFPKYRRKFEMYDSIFGAGNVHFWKFDPASFANGDVVLDFCSRLGIEFPAALSVRANEGLSVPATALLYTYRKYGPGYGIGPDMVRENILLIRRLAKLRGPKVRIHSSLVKPTIEAWNEDIAWMEQRLGASLQENLAIHDADAIRTEDDLLTYAPETLQWLAEQLGPDYSNGWQAGLTPEQVADWVHCLRKKLAAEDPSRVTANRAKPTQSSLTVQQGGEGIDAQEWVQRARQANPQLEKLPETMSIALLQEALDQIGLSIAQADEGMIKVAGLGQFRVKPLVREVNGKQVTDKRVLFQLESRPRPPAKPADEASATRLIPRIQERNSTRYNRYKNVFAAVRRACGQEQPKILSFGCSNGEEPLSLSELWFPESRILGLDVNEACLKEAAEKTRPVCDKVKIAYSSQEVIDTWAPFDIVFAMSVLCAWPNSKKLKDISSLYAFADFERHVSLLGDALRLGGLLVIWNASFKFTDTCIAAKFEPVPIKNINESGFVKKFGPDNKELAVQDYPFFIFRKIEQ